MRIHPFLFASLVATHCLASAAERLIVDVAHDLDAARPSETITIPWSAVDKALPGALLQHIAVTDEAGHVLPYQVTNINPEARDPGNTGIAYGELIFQHDFAVGEKHARFTVARTAAVSPPFPIRAFARHVPERLDDFAWENDEVAHRTYGQALAAPAAPGSDKEVLVTSGIDIWFKRVPYPIVDRWYNKGHDHYHKEEGEGLDMYGVGTTRGAGGTGIWDGKRLYTSRNYMTWKVIANGPIRAIFELSYAPWDAGGTRVSEVKRFTIDAGHEFDTVDSTFVFDGADRLPVAIGLNKAPAYPDQHPVVKTQPLANSYALAQWVTQRGNGDFGTAIIVPGATAVAYAEDRDNALILATAASGKPLRYYLGAAAGWSKDVHDQADWHRKVEAEATRIAAPIRVTLSTAN
jgi:hypothetical protein